MLRGLFEAVDGRQDVSSTALRSSPDCAARPRSGQPMTISLHEPPLLSRLNGHDRILIAGAGGGFDVYAGLPLARGAPPPPGKQVFLANLTFTYLGETDAPLPGAAPRAVTAETTGADRYFPERRLAEWLRRAGAPVDHLRVREGGRASPARRVCAPRRGAGGRGNRPGRRRHGHPHARGRRRARNAGRGHDQPGGCRGAGRRRVASSRASASAWTRIMASATRTFSRTSRRSSATAATWARSR